MEPILAVDNLNVRFATRNGEVRAVSDLSFTLAPGECLGIVGESGSGKTQTFLAMLGLLARNGTATGRVVYKDRDLLALKRRDLDQVRGDRVCMVFQDALTSLTPHMRIGQQLIEVLIEHKGMDRAAAERRALHSLERVHIPDAAKRMRMYPHELSGGLRQRLMIAMALLCEPDVLIADEPTTALDVTVQAQILSIFHELKGNTRSSIILITHDLGVIAGVCDTVMVMYAGKIVEKGSVEDIFYRPQHPYTKGLLASMPNIDMGEKSALPAIPGQPPDLEDLPQGCAFHPRCAETFELCREREPSLQNTKSGGIAACHLLEKT